MYRILSAFIAASVILILFPMPIQAQVTRNVDRNDPTCSNVAGTPYCTIQAAVTAASAGDTIEIAAGTYVEYVTINKALRLQGANAGIAGTGTRGAETILLPPDNTRVLLGGLITITVRNVIIDGLVLDGDNPGVGGGQSFNGVDANVTTGILAESPSPSSIATMIQAVEVRNSIIRNMNRYGFYGDASLGDVYSGNGSIIENNWFNNIAGLYSNPAPFTAERTAILITSNFYTTIRNNTFTAVGRGINMTNFFRPGTGSISNNTITSERYGILYNNHYQTASSIPVSNTIVNTVPGFENINIGVRISTIVTGVNVSVDNTRVDDARFGIWVWNLPTSGTVTVNNALLCNNDYGLRYDNFLRTEVNVHDLTINDINIVNSRTVNLAVINDDAITNTPLPNGPHMNLTANRVAINALPGTIGVLLNDTNDNDNDGDPVTAPDNAVTINLQDSSIQEAGTALQFSNAAGTAGTSFTINNSALFNSTTGANNLTAVSMNAQNNWWGTATGPTHTSNPGGTGLPVSNNVNFSGFLTDQPTVPLVDDADCEEVVVPPVVVVTPTPVPPAVDPGSAPALAAAIPTISKTVDKPLAAIGDSVRYTLTISSSAPLDNVVISDTLDDRLENVRVVSTSAGSAIISGSTVTVQGSSVSSDQPVTVIIEATISRRALPADRIFNSASLNGLPSNQVQTIVLPGELPATGEYPPAQRWWSLLVYALDRLGFAFSPLS